MPHQRTQEELQRQLVKLGWTIGQQSQYPDVNGEVIPLRLLATTTLKELSTQNAANPPEVHLDVLKDQLDVFKPKK